MTIDASFNAFAQVVTKHVLGSSERFSELKELLAMCEHAKDKTTAAALGYLIAMEENEREELFNIYDAVEATVGQVGDNLLKADEAASIIFGLIYNWTREAMVKEDMHDAAGLLDELFDAYLRPSDKV